MSQADRLGLAYILALRTGYSGWHVQPMGRNRQYRCARTLAGPWYIAQIERGDYASAVESVIREEGLRKNGNNNN